MDRHLCAAPVGMIPCIHMSALEHVRARHGPLQAESSHGRPEPPGRPAQAPSPTLEAASNARGRGMRGRRASGRGAGSGKRAAANESRRTSLRPAPGAVSTVRSGPAVEPRKARLHRVRALRAAERQQRRGSVLLGVPGSPATTPGRLEAMWRRLLRHGVAWCGTAWYKCQWYGLAWPGRVG